MSKAGRSVSIQYGMADQPGRWDHWPTGLICTTAEEESVEGTLVIGPASILFPFDRYTTEPIVLKFEHGVAASIEGGREAVMLRDLLATQNSPNCRRLAHVGWVQTTGRAGISWHRAATTAVAERRPVRSMGACCSRLERIATSAARTPHHCTLISRCAAHALSWMELLSSRTVISSTLTWPNYRCWARASRGSRTSVSFAAKGAMWPT